VIKNIATLKNDLKNYILVYAKNSRQHLNYQIFRETVLQFIIIIIIQTLTKNTIRSMKMNNSQWKMDAQDILAPLIDRVDFQLPPLRQPALHPSLDLNPSSPGLSGRLSCTPPSKITVGVAWVIFRFCLACSNYHVNTTKTVIILMSVQGVGGGMIPLDNYDRSDLKIP